MFHRLPAPSRSARSAIQAPLHGVKHLLVFPARDAAVGRRAYIALIGHRGHAGASTGAASYRVNRRHPPVGPFTSGATVFVALGAHEVTLVKAAVGFAVAPLLWLPAHRCVTPPSTRNEASRAKVAYFYGTCRVLGAIAPATRRQCSRLPMRAWKRRPIAVSDWAAASPYLKGPHGRQHCIGSE